MSFGRFERKILAALVVAAAVPLVGALVLGRVALREVYQVGVNARIRDELERGLGLYRDYFALLRQTAGDSASAVSDDWAVREALLPRDKVRLEERLRALLAQYPDIAGIAPQDAE